MGHTKRNTHPKYPERTLSIVTKAFPQELYQKATGSFFIKPLQDIVDSDIDVLKNI